MGHPVQRGSHNPSTWMTSPKSPTAFNGINGTATNPSSWWSATPNPASLNISKIKKDGVVRTSRQRFLQRSQEKQHQKHTSHQWIVIGIISELGALDPVTSHNLLQRLAFHAAPFGCLGDIPVAFFQEAADIGIIEIFQRLFLGFFVRQISKSMLAVDPG